MIKSKKIVVVGAGGFIGGHLVKKVLNWSFKIKLKDGLQKTYDWMDKEISKQGVNISRFTKS
tara:strand:- start:97 stop:282 length:186 start_codon:yes stop_codon:yes gene_type:complete